MGSVVHDATKRLLFELARAVDVSDFEHRRLSSGRKLVERQPQATTGHHYRECRPTSLLAGPRVHPRRASGHEFARGRSGTFPSWVLPPR